MKILYLFQIYNHAGPLRIKLIYLLGIHTIVYVSNILAIAAINPVIAVFTSAKTEQVLSEWIKNKMAVNEKLTLSMTCEQRRYYTHLFLNARIGSRTF